MKEKHNLEFKETVTNTFLKTVSAFANYDGGDILFGISDSGNTVGLEEPEKASLDIENKINDSISPQPDFRIDIGSNHIVRVTVKPGTKKPYLYKAKAYKRNDTATVEVDNMELTRLILEGKNIRFEELPSKQQDLTFQVLEQKLRNRIQLDTLNQDVLRTLNLYNNSEGYNNVAAILADRNIFPGIDIAKFGENINVIQKRKTIMNQSIFTAYDAALEIYHDFYVYEKIEGAERKTIERIPETAFREAIANAIIHRAWDVNANIRISMFDDRIEIVSPGGLPSGITEDEYLTGRISVLRNVILANIFYRLGYVEIFGTGINRIKELYKNSFNQPRFVVSETVILMELPIVEINRQLTKDEMQVVNVLSKTTMQPIGKIVEQVDFGKSKTQTLLKKLNNNGIIEIVGAGRGTKYRLR